MHWNIVQRNTASTATGYPNIAPSLPPRAKTLQCWLLVCVGWLLVCLELIHSGHMGDKLHHTVGVAPLIVIPRYELDKCVIEGDTSLGVKYG